MPLQGDEFLGRMVSLWPVATAKDGLNLVHGYQCISHRIISLLLFRKGEHPRYPNFGLAVDLFDPTTSYDVEFWVFQVENEINRWFAGEIDSFSVQVDGYNVVRNELQTAIQFTPARQPSRHILTFPWYQYQGVLFDRAASNDFWRYVNLDGSPFLPFT